MLIIFMYIPIVVLQGNLLGSKRKQSIAAHSEIKCNNVICLL